jgi:hypothetical protein
MPETNVKSSVVENPLSHETQQRNQKCKCYKSEVIYGRMISNELLGFVTNVRTVPGRIAKWHSTQVYVRVSICSDDIKETCEWIARILAECSGS